MKRILLLLLLLPLMAQAQTEQKVLYMTVTRTSGSDVSVRLVSSDDFVGPILNMETSVFDLGAVSTRRTRVKEIRFEIKTEEVTAIESVDEEVESTDDAIYNLAGQRLDGRSLPKGIYIRNGKKYLK